jgi:probable phosphoglycerate mutase
MQLLFIRHAQTQSNVLGLLDSGVPGPDLTELGRAQAAAIPTALADREWGRIYASVMRRTAQTGSPLAEAIGREVEVREGLHEIEAGDLEMRGDAEAYGAYVSAVWAWARGELDLPMPGAAGGREFFARFDAAVETIMEEAEATPVVISHGASIRVWVAARCRNVDGGHAEANDLHNTGSALVERSEDGSWELLEWNALPLGGPAVAGLTAIDIAASHSRVVDE